MGARARSTSPPPPPPLPVLLYRLADAFNMFQSRRRYGEQREGREGKVLRKVGSLATSSQRHRDLSYRSAALYLGASRGLPICPGKAAERFLPLSALGHRQGLQGKIHHLVGRVVKASVSRAEDPGFESL